MNPTNTTTVPTTIDTSDEIPSTIDLTIPRDLAVQIVGSDAGKERRFRPTRTMTKYARPDQIAAVEQLMQPFLDSEIHRYHTDRTSRMAEVRITASSTQASALENMVRHYADHTQRHWDRKGHDPRHHRSKQRLDQARDVIRQINRGLGLGDHDGRTVLELETVADELMHDLYDVITVMLDRIQQADIDTAENHRQPGTVDAWRSLRDHLQRKLEVTQPPYRNAQTTNQPGAPIMTTANRHPQNHEPIRQNKSTTESQEYVPHTC